VAEVFAAERMSLHLAARNGEAMLDAKQDLEARHGVKVTIHALDLSAPAAMEQLAAAVGDIDILINNAGDIPAGSLEILDDAAWRRGFDLKVFGYIPPCRVFIIADEGKDGVILNMIGNSGENWMRAISRGAPECGAMSFTRRSAAKASTTGFASLPSIRVRLPPTACSDHERKAIDMLGDEGAGKNCFDKYPSKRPATSEEVADLVAFLSSPKAATSPAPCDASTAASPPAASVDLRRQAMSKLESTALIRNRYFRRTLGDAGLYWLGQNTNHIESIRRCARRCCTPLRPGEFNAYAPPWASRRCAVPIVTDLGTPGAERS